MKKLSEKGRGEVAKGRTALLSSMQAKVSTGRLIDLRSTLSGSCSLFSHCSLVHYLRSEGAVLTSHPFHFLCFECDS